MGLAGVPNALQAAALSSKGIVRRCADRVQSCRTCATAHGPMGGRVERRCGSVVTMVKMGRSVYGLVKCFYRVCCSCNVFTDFVVLTWFPPTEYPDRDPLTVRISLNGVDVNNITSLDVVPLYSIQPSRVAVRFDRTNDCMYVMRLEGLDKSPLFNN